MRRRRAGLFASAAAAIAWGPAAAEAHAFGARYDLPLPLGFYLAAAGAAVAVSFIASFIFIRRETTRAVGLQILVPPRLAAAAAATLRTAGVLLFVCIVATALFGPQAPTKNFATVTVWVLWWVGLLLFCALVADIWRFIDPFRGMLGWAASRWARRHRKHIRLPRQAGWLAVAGLILIACLELISDWSEEPRALGVIILLYAGATLLAARLFGATAWLATADPIARLFDLMGRMAPIAAAPGRRIWLRPPAEGLLEPVDRPPGSTAFIVSLIAVVLFDGLSETPFWASILEWLGASESLRGPLVALQSRGVDLLKLVRAAGLLTTVLTANVAYLALAWAMSVASGREMTPAAMAGVFAASLLPIAVAYHLSHYFSYLALAGQLIIPIVSDPFGLGWNLFGTRGRPIDIGVVDAEQVWWIAAAALVAGHSLSVLVAHRQAVKLFGSASLAVRSQLPMMVFMVGLTMLSLWILAQPIVE